MSAIYGPLVPADIVVALRAGYVDSYCTIVASVIVVYDHLTTLSREYEFIWGRKFSSVTLLFHLNRCFILAFVVLDLVLQFNIFSTALTYVPAVLMSAVHINFAFAVLIATRTCVITADAIVLAITIARTYSVQRYATRNNLRTPLVTMLLKNGVLHFFALLCLNLVNILGQTSNVFSFATGFIAPLSSIIISHFLMSLRQVASALQDYEDNVWQASMHSRTWGTSQSFSLKFASFVDDMGESLGQDSDYANAEISAVEHHVLHLQESSALCTSTVVEANSIVQASHTV
ncbi:hypothetical protein CERSUDRAFT_100903 [Gelatoporia subvermispora B]|uniref:DUF6533 domain-containing protein n=1 Tax=Ceriporiopsis subvermispora (strain B) TaxID=914234 RepID=M2P6I4_CERS8|nr:hypothetical protein CERSUDRAFT_100903 [Gelatoporia subvermispora B]